MKKRIILPAILLWLAGWQIATAEEAPAGDYTLERSRLRGLIEENLYRNPSQGRDYIFRLEEEARRNGDITTEAYARTKILEYYYPFFDNDSLFTAAREAEDFARQHKQYRYLFLVKQIVVQRYVNEGKYGQGLAGASAMHEDAKAFGGPEDRARAVAAMANIYKHLGRYEESMAYHRESLLLMEESGKGKEASLFLENYRELAFAHQRLEEYEQTLFYADSMRLSIALAGKDGLSDDTESLFIAEALTAQAYTALKRMGDAAAAVEKMESLFDPGFPRSFRLLRYEALIGYHREKGDYRQAYGLNEELLSLANRLELTTPLPEIFRNKAGLLALLGRPAEAVPLYEEAIDRQRKEEKSRHNQQLNELRTLYDLDKLEARAREDKLRLRFSRNISLAFALVAALLAGIVLLVIRQVRRVRQKNRGLVRQMAEYDRLAAVAEAHEAEIRRLKHQLSPTRRASQAEETEDLPTALGLLMKKEKPFTNPEFNWKMLGDRLGVSEAQLRAALKKQYDMTVSEYITRQRLEYARHLLATSHQSISSASLDAGFGSRITFYRLFRKHYGLSPDEFRREA